VLTAPEGGHDATSPHAALPQNHDTTCCCCCCCCCSATRSSLHLDPYHNLLCVVAGSKKVTLFSPEVTPAMYPRPVWGDSSNHSAVNFAEPDAQVHPLFSHAKAQALTVELGPGDALFIPEGWWHQVDSAGVCCVMHDMCTVCYMVRDVLMGAVYFLLCAAWRVMRAYVLHAA
jgi:Cupin-like domain